MSAPDANGWMPIETAPKDGEFFLAVPAGERRRGKPWLQSIVHWEARVADFIEYHDEDHPPHKRDGIPFAHWQPLPNPPVQP